MRIHKAQSRGSFGPRTRIGDLDGRIQSRCPLYGATAFHQFGDLPLDRCAGIECRERGFRCSL